MTPLIDLYNAVAAAWPEMQQPVCAPGKCTLHAGMGYDPEHPWHRSHDGLDEPTARLICAAVWAENAMREGAIFAECPTAQSWTTHHDPVIYKGGFATIDKVDSIYGTETEIEQTGPDLCEAAANALVELAKEKR